MLVADSVDRWLAHRWATRELASRSVNLYKSRLALFVHAYGGRPAVTVGRSELQAWAASLAAVSPATRRLYISAMRCWLRWAAEEGHVAAGLDKWLPKVREPRRAPRARSYAEVAAVFAACRTPREAVIVALMVHLGLRACEVARADMADWDRTRSTLLVRGKRGDERVLPVPAGAAAILEDYRDGMAPHGPLVCDRTARRGLHPQTVAAMVARVLYRAGVKHRPGDGVTAHALRHTALSDILDRCGNVRIVQAVAGHRSLATTQVYLRRASLDQMRQAMEGRCYLPTGAATLAAQ